MPSALAAAREDVVMDDRPRIWYRAARGRWYATLEGRQVMLDGDTRKAALAALERLLGEDARSAGPTLADALAGFLAASARAAGSGELAAATLLQRRSRLAGCPPALLARGLTTIRPVELSPWIDRPGLAPTTRGCTWTVVRQAARWAVESGLVDDCPLAHARVRRPKPPRRRLATDDEFARWVGRMPDELRELARFLRDTGCRPGEARRITAADLDGEFAVMREHKTARETGQARMIPLPGDWPNRLRAMARDRPTGPLFRNHDGGPWCPMALCQAFARARTRAGLERHVVAYSLRHSRITRWLASGVPVATVAALVGHANPTMTLSVYSHVVTMHDHLRETVRKMGA
jgi:integrase